MNSDLSPEELARQLEDEANKAQDRQIEQQFRDAFLQLEPSIDLSKVTIVSDIANDNLLIDGVDDELIDQALVIVRGDGDE
jgi:phage baseplate assembly protein W